MKKATAILLTLLAVAVFLCGCRMPVTFETPNEKNIPKSGTVQVLYDRR